MRPGKLVSRSEGSITRGRGSSEPLCRLALTPGRQVRLEPELPLPRWERFDCRVRVYCFWPRAFWRAQDCPLWGGGVRVQDSLSQD